MFERRLIDVGGASLEAFLGGSGSSPICFAHNFDVLTSDGGLATAALSRVTRTIGVNLRSMGGSSEARSPDELSMARAVVDLEALRSKLGFERWVFTGYSAGGFIGIRYALEHPGALAGLILVDTAPSYRVFLDPASIYCRHNASYAKVEAAQGTQEWAEVLWPLVSYDAETVVHHARRCAGISEARQSAQIAEIRAYDFEADLQRIAVPTLIIHGRHDASMPISQGELIATRIPGARLEVFERSGHFPFWEEEDKFESVVDDFVRTLG